MHKITYHHKGPKGDQVEGPEETKVGLHTFKSGEPVLIDSANHSAPWTLMNNPWFTVEAVKSKGKKEKSDD